MSTNQKHYPPLMRAEAKRLRGLGLTPQQAVAQLNVVRGANPSLRWPEPDRKLLWKWWHRLAWSFTPSLGRSSKDNQHLVFVYGTLKRGMGNDRLLKQGGANFMAEAKTAQAYVMYDGGFPYVADIRDVRRKGNPSHIDGAGQIKGEVWLANDATLARLDMLEGVPHHYRRDKVEVVVDGAVIEAGMYVMQRVEQAVHRGEQIKRDDAGCLSWPTPQNAERQRRWAS